MIVNEPELAAELKKMTRSVFSEVMGYFISESLYLETKELSPKAAGIIEELEEIEDELIDRIRQPLVRMHRINLQKTLMLNLTIKNLLENKE